MVARNKISHLVTLNACKKSENCFIDSFLSKFFVWNDVIDDVDPNAILSDLCKNCHKHPQIDCEAGRKQPFTLVFDIDISTEFIHNYFWLFRFLIRPCVLIIRVWLRKRGYPNTAETHFGLTIGHKWSRKNFEWGNCLKMHTVHRLNWCDVAKLTICFETKLLIKLITILGFALLVWSPQLKRNDCNF